MTDKSSHSHTSKKSGKTIKEKRAEKRAKHPEPAAQDPVAKVVKR